MNDVTGVPPDNVGVWAANLMRLRTNVIPLHPWREGEDRSKRPTESWAEYQTAPQIDSLDDPAAWIKARWLGDPVCGLAVITGKISNLVVIDADSTDEVEFLTELLGSIPTTTRVATRKGEHIWFTYPAGHIIRNQTRVGGHAIDVRGDGGYVVVPPSIHPSGRRYQWIKSPLDGWPPAEMPRELLTFILPKERRSHVPPHQPPASADAHCWPYLRAALEREADAVANAREGERNHALNRAAFNLARFVVAGQLDRERTAEILVYAARLAGLGSNETYATIESGMRSGGAL